MEPLKILDITIKNPSKIKLTEVVKETGFCYSYVFQLLDPKNYRKNKKALQRVRNAIVKVYGSIIEIEEHQHA